MQEFKPVKKFKGQGGSKNLVGEVLKANFQQRQEAKKKEEEEREEMRRERQGGKGSR